MKRMPFFATLFLLPTPIFAAPLTLDDKVLADIAHNADRQCQIVIETDAGLKIDAMRFSASPKDICRCVGDAMVAPVGADAESYEAYQKDAPRFSGDLAMLLRQRIYTCGEAN